MPFIDTSKEFKNKPAQNALNDLRGFGIVPEIVVVRSDEPAPESVAQKIALYGGVDLPGVLMLPNLDTVFMIPERIAASPLMTILDKFTGNFAQPNLAKWQALTQLQSKKPADIVTVGLVAKYMENKDTYLSVTEALKSAAWHENVGLYIKWLNVETVTGYRGARPRDAVDFELRSQRRPVV